ASERAAPRQPVRKGRALFNSVPLCGTSPRSGAPVCRQFDHPTTHPPSATKSAIPSKQYGALAFFARPLAALSPYSCLASLSARTDLGTAPICLSTTSPFLKYSRAGMLRMPYLTEISGLLSTFTLPITALPSYSAANSSTIGPTMRQGPHHSAQKSTNTGLSDCNTTSSKLLSVISNAMMLICYAFDGL